MTTKRIRTRRIRIRIRTRRTRIRTTIRTIMRLQRSLQMTWNHRVQAHKTGELRSPIFLARAPVQVLQMVRATILRGQRRMPRTIRVIKVRAGIKQAKGINQLHQLHQLRKMRNNNTLRMIKRRLVKMTSFLTLGRIKPKISNTWSRLKRRWSWRKRPRL